MLLGVYEFIYSIILCVFYLFWRCEMCRKARIILCGNMIGTWLWACLDIVYLSCRKYNVGLTQAPLQGDVGSGRIFYISIYIIYIYIVGKIKVNHPPNQHK